MHYHTRAHPHTRTIDFKALDFSCGGPIRFRNIDTIPVENAALELQNLTEESHRNYLENFIESPPVREKFGDMRSQINGQLTMLKTFGCTDSKSADDFAPQAEPGLGVEKAATTSR